MRRVSLTLAAALLAAVAARAQQQPQQPIRSGVELVRIDVQVSSRDGRPAENLRADQFEVSIDGKRLPIATLDFVRYSTTTGVTPQPVTTAPSAAAATGAVPSEEPRVLILAIDEPSFMTQSRQAPVEVVKRIAAMADPRDSIGLIAFPQPGVLFSPSLDRAALLEAAARIDGRLVIPTHNRLQFSIADAIDWSTDADYRTRIIKRECPDMSCSREVEMMANEFIGAFQMQAQMSISGLKNAVEILRQYPGRKTMLLVSGGFVASDRIGAANSSSMRAPDVRSEADMLGKRAAEANVVIYSLHTDVAFLHAFSSPQAARHLQTALRNSSLMAAGLEQFTASAGGTLIPVPASPDKALARVLSETSAYYLLGVEPPAELRDGKTHRITVRVKQSGTQVRSRSSVMIPKS